MLLKMARARLWFFASIISIRFERGNAENALYGPDMLIVGVNVSSSPASPRDPLPLAVTCSKSSIDYCLFNLWRVFFFCSHPLSFCFGKRCWRSLATEALKIFRDSKKSKRRCILQIPDKPRYHIGQRPISDLTCYSR